jgi:hypothetical protein
MIIIALPRDYMDCVFITDSLHVFSIYMALHIGIYNMGFLYLGTQRHLTCSRPYYQFLRAQGVWVGSPLQSDYQPFQQAPS